MAETEERKVVTPYPPVWAKSRIGYLRQYDYFAGLFRLIGDVPGDIVECGLGWGDSFTMLAHLTGRDGNRMGRRLRGFDSFEGWPEPSTFDQSWRNPKKGEWNISRKEFDGEFAKANLPKFYPGLEVVITPGFLGDTLPAEAARGYQIAFLHLDVDLYESYRAGLENLFPLVAPGGIVCFDEYREFASTNPAEEKWPGATKAINEYLEKTGRAVLYHEATKKYYVVK